jgi:hypothetical protein
LWSRRKRELHISFDLVDYLDYHQEINMPRMHNPAHPGEVLREFLPENLSITEAARRLGVTRQKIKRAWPLFALESRQQVAARSTHLAA